MVIVLVMHGMPPADFPVPEKQEFMRLHARLTQSPGPLVKERHDVLERKLRQWPRTPENDPFHAASYALARALESQAGARVLVGFNEFCDPTVDMALNQAAALDEEIAVVTPMLMRGGSHAEQEIPALIAAAQKRHPHKRIRYAWPFQTEHIARFLAEHLNPVASNASISRSA